VAIEVVWEQLLGHGLEHLILKEGDSIEADGVAVGTLKDFAYRVHYRVLCDAGWNVQQFQVQSLTGVGEISLRKRGLDWVDDAGTVQPGLRGCSEVDIMVTPFTNTLPIRRLGLRAGQAAEIAVAYVSIPDLQVSRAEQIYTCLEDSAEGGLVRYESMTTGFKADLKVDGDRLVTDYPGIFRLVWKKANAEGPRSGGSLSQTDVLPD